jgi:cell division protein FtsQ
MYRAVGFAYSTDRLAIRNVQVRGESRVTESEILARAGFVPGTNALRVDLDQIREDVERLLWVRYAAVHRVWPNELVISVVEREPVGLARISGEIYQVDADGVILPVNAAASPSFPILDGLAVGDGEDAIQANAAKIEIYRETLSLLGEGGLSEVHVSGSGEVSVVPIDDPVVVDLGSTDHRIRWQKYLNLKNRIRDDYPTALRIDLRFKDQVIIQIEGREPAERILWGEETELL